MTHDPAEALRKIADEIFERWDKDQRSGKLLTALAGRLPGYRADVDAVLAALASPAPAGGEVDNPKALAIFTEYFVKNYPGPDTIIHKPQWHAPKIFRAAQHAIAQTATVTPPPASPDMAGVAERLRTAHDHVERMSYADTAALAYDALAVIESLSADKGRLEAMIDAKLPCEVVVAPATHFAKGVRVSTLLAAIERRTRMPGTEEEAQELSADPGGEKYAKGPHP